MNLHGSIKTYLKYLVLLFTLILLSNCIAKNNVEVTLKNPQKKEKAQINVTKIQVINNQIIITGSNLNNITDFNIKDGSTKIALQIESKNSTTLVANTISNVSFAAGRIFDFILSNAEASSTFTVNFSLCDSTIGDIGFSCSTPHQGDVLAYDSSTKKWTPKSVMGLAYKGTHDASTSVDPAPASPVAGDYYIINVVGTINTVAYAVGDWIVYNADTSTWQKVSISSAIVAIDKTTVQPLSSVKLYGVNAANYVQLTVPALTGNTVYKFPAADGTNGQVLSTDSAGNLSWATISAGGSGTVTSVSSANADIGVANGTTTPTLTLNVGTGANQIIKLNGTSQLPAVSGNLLTSLNAANISGAVPIANGGTGSTTAADARTALGLASAGTYATGSTNGSIPLLGASGIVANNICVGDVGGGSISCATANTSAGLLGLLSDETGTGLAVFNASPTFTGTPLAPTAAANTNTTQIATTAFVMGQLGTNITTVGTISSGTWNGSVVGMTYGGTGANITPVNGGVVYSNAANMAVTAAGTSGQYLKSAGAATPTWSSILLGDLKSSVAGNLFPGTGCSTNETLTYSSGTDSFSCVAISIGKVRAATTANVVIATGGLLTIDGVVTVAGDRVLLKNQTAAAENGVYVVSAGAWTRATDLDTWTEAIGYKVQVSEGTVWAGMSFSSAALASGTIGTTSYYWNTSGSAIGDGSNYNTANGLNALSAATTGYYNVAGGAYALLVNTTGNSNTANGYKTLYANTSGTQNTAIGNQALLANATNSYNTAVGSYALYSNAGGAQGTAVGAGALYSNTTASFNVAVGQDSLRLNTTGGPNVAIGTSALYNNTTGYYNVASGYQALKLNTTGDSNVANGYQALYSNTTGYYNTAVGREALYSNTANENTAYGYKSLYSNTTGAQNTANGRGALYSNSTASENTATGFNSLYLNTTGYDNTANGYLALYSNTTGFNNTATGMDALYSNTTGFYNTSTGSYALYANLIGSYNTATGHNALRFSTGDSDTAIGYRALYNNTTGFQNIGVGYNAGNAITTGNYNVVIGSYPSTAIAALSNNILLADGQGNLRMQIDSAGATTFVGTVTASGVMSLSDMRLKKDIKQIPDALERLTSLNGVSYNWNHSFHPELNLGDKPQLGVLAQQVEKVFPEAVMINEKGIKSVSYNMLIAPIIESIKELYHAWFDDSKEIHREIASLKEENKMLRKYLCEKDKEAEFCSEQNQISTP